MAKVFFKQPNEASPRKKYANLDQKYKKQNYLLYISIGINLVLLSFLLFNNLR